MDQIAEGMKRANEEEALFDSAKSANIAASATMARWLRHAKKTFGADHEITQHYASLLETLKEQHELIWDGNKKAMDEAGRMAIEINRKYGGKKESDISASDHLRLHKPDGPR